MSDAEIKNSFLENLLLKPAGISTQSQLKNREGKSEKLILDAYYRASTNIKINAIRVVVLFFLGTALAPTAAQHRAILLGKNANVNAISRRLRSKWHTKAFQIQPLIQ